MEPVATEDKCPRCAVSPHPFLGEPEDHGATSRSSMEGKPPITVCAACREREVHRGAAGLPPIPFSRWPIPLAALVEEERLRFAYLREKPVSETLRARRRRERAKSEH
jgi:hypothetical protein